MKQFVWAPVRTGKGPRLHGSRAYRSAPLCSVRPAPALEVEVSARTVCLEETIAPTTGGIQDPNQSHRPQRKGTAPLQSRSLDEQDHQGAVEVSDLSHMLMRVC